MARTADTKHLLSLPAEMLEAIADEAEPHDLLALRMSCRKMFAAAEDHFIDAFFTTRSHVLCRSALEALVDITAGPKLVKKIKMVEFVVLKLELWQPCGRNGQPILVACPSAKTLEDKQLSLKRPYHGAVREIINNGDGEDMIRDLILQIFKNLTATQVVPAIAAYGRVADDAQGSFGMARLEQNRFIGTSNFEVGVAPSLSSAIMDAIVVTDFPATSLELGLGTGFSEVERGMRGITQALVEKASTSAPFRNLRSLNVNLASEVVGTIPDRQCLYKFFVRASNLQDLCISGGLWVDHIHDDLDHPFAVMGQALCASNLTSIRIDDFEALPRHLFELLNQHKNTLKKLALLFIDLLGDNCWGLVCDQLATQFALETVEMEALTTDHEQNRFVCGAKEGTDKFHCMIHGEEQIRTELRRLATTPEYLAVTEDDGEDGEDGENGDQNEDEDEDAEDDG